MTDDNPWTLIFAGTADIDESNLAALLDHWLPADLEVNPPVIPSVNAGTHPGLVKVHAYLTDQFGDDALEHVPSLAEYLTGGLKPGPDQYLVVLWGDGGDEETEKLVDLASRLGVTVLDLTDGLEEFVLGTEPPEEPAPAPAPSRVSRRRADRREDSAAGPAPEAQEDAAADPDALTGLERIAAGILHRALTAALKELQQPESEAPGGEAANGSAKAATARRRDVPAPAAETAAAVNGNYPQQAAPGVEYSADADVEAPSGTKKYLIDPATNDYVRLRGRPRTDRKDWKFIYLTPEHEQQFGLVPA